MNDPRFIDARLEYLRGEIRAERISYGELAELKSLAAHIDPGDTELLQWAGVPEHTEERVYKITETAEYGVRASSEAEALELFLENPNGYLSVVTDRTVELSEEDD